MKNITTIAYILGNLKIAKNNMKTLIKILCLSVLWFSCDPNIDYSGLDPGAVINDGCSTCLLEIDAPDLNLLSDGHYQMIINPDFPNYSQTILEAYVGRENEVQLVSWNSDTWISELDIPIISGSTESNDDGYSTKILSVNSEHIGVTAKIYATYYEDEQFLDSIYISFE